MPRQLVKKRRRAFTTRWHGLSGKLTLLVVYYLLPACFSSFYLSFWLHPGAVGTAVSLQSYPAHYKWLIAVYQAESLAVWSLEELHGCCLDFGSGKLPLSRLSRWRIGSLETQFGGRWPCSWSGLSTTWWICSTFWATCKWLEECRLWLHLIWNVVKTVPMSFCPYS